MTIYFKHPKDSTRRSGVYFHQSSRIKFNIHKIVTFLHSNNKLTEKDAREVIPFTIA
jgi:hypothetical protein